MEFINDFFGGMELNTLLIIGAVWSFLIVPLTFFGSLKIHTMQVINKKNAQLRSNDTPYEPKWNSMKPKLEFTMKDKRGVIQKKNEEIDADEEPKFPFFNRRLLFFVLLIGGLISGPLLMYLEYYLYAFIVPFVLFYSAILYGLNSPVKIMKQHDELYNKMYKIVSSQLGVEEELRGNPRNVITVTKWAADMVTPLRVDIKVPTNFNAGGEQAFIEQFNQVYGTQRAWVARSTEKDVPGWDYENGVVHLYAVPPIPMIAPWHERYVLTEGIAWSFFPVGLGAENGVEMVNPETGKKENVLGFDVAGEQSSVGKKHGLPVGSEVVTSPMVLIGGSTGSGKAIANDTPVLILKENTNEYDDTETLKNPPEIDADGLKAT